MFYEVPRSKGLFGNLSLLIMATIALSPLFWVLGLNLVVFHAISVCAFLKIYSIEGKKSHPFPLLALAAYSIIYLISIVLAAVSGAESSRIIAGLYNWSYWLMGYFIIYSIVNDKNDLNIAEFFPSIYKCLLILFALSLVVFLISFSLTDLRPPSLIGFFLPLGSLPPLIADSFTLKLLSTDWFAGVSTPRMSLIAPYPTAFGMTVLAFLMFSLVSRASLVLIFISGVMVYFSLSRMAMLFYILILFSCILINLDSRIRRVLIGILVFSLLLFFPLIYVYVPEFWKEFNSVRQGSSDTRMYLYQLSIQVAWENSPFFGMGIKSRDELLIPLGSHSTLVGSFYKCGFLGFLMLSFFFIYFVAKSMVIVLFSNSRNAFLAALMLVFIIYSCFEDLDAPQLLSFIFFVVAGLVCKVSRVKVV